MLLDLKESILVPGSDGDSTPILYLKSDLVPVEPYLKCIKVESEKSSLKELWNLSVWEIVIRGIKNRIAEKICCFILAS
jgi:hypothetical protein